MNNRPRCKENEVFFGSAVQSTFDILNMDYLKVSLMSKNTVLAQPQSLFTFQLLSSSSSSSNRTGNTKWNVIGPAEHAHALKEIISHID